MDTELALNADDECGMNAEARILNTIQRFTLQRFNAAKPKNGR